MVGECRLSFANDWPETNLLARSRRKIEIRTASRAVGLYSHHIGSLEPLDEGLSVVSDDELVIGVDMPVCASGQEAAIAANEGDQRRGRVTMNLELDQRAGVIGWRHDRAYAFNFGIHRH